MALLDQHRVGRAADKVVDPVGLECHLVQILVRAVEKLRLSAQLQALLLVFRAGTRAGLEVSELSTASQDGDPVVKPSSGNIARGSHTQGAHSRSVRSLQHNFMTTQKDKSQLLHLALLLRIRLGM
eukprot:768078-Hanusia_phi.AAC.1